MSVQKTNVVNQEENLIDITELLNDFWKIFRRMWVWVLLLTIAGSGIFYIRARQQYVPVYTASGTFIVSGKSDQTNGSLSSYYNNAAAQQMSATFPHILTSGLMRRKVAENMGVNLGGSNIQASVEENTNLLTISVTDRDADMAYAVLQAVIETYPSIADSIVGKTNMEMMDETGVPVTPDNPPQYKRAALKGALVGMAAGILWILLLISTRRTVCKESDVRKYMNTQCLGMIPEVTFKRRSRKKKTGLVITEPKVDKVFREPLRIIRNKIAYSAEEYRIKTFVITSALAGEGKSTVAVNLALTLAGTGKKVVLMDCDLRNPSDRQLLGLERGAGLREVLEGKKEIKECILTAKDLGLDPKLNFRFIPGGKGIADGSELLGSVKMKRIIDAVEAWADYVILDTAPAGLITDAVVLAQYAGGAVFVVRKDFARADDIMDGMEQMADSNVMIIGAVLNGM